MIGIDMHRERFSDEAMAGMRQFSFAHTLNIPKATAGMIAQLVATQSDQTSS